MFRLVVVFIPLLFSFVLFGVFVVRAQRPEPTSQPNQEIKPIVAPQAKQAPRTQRIREGTAFKGKIVFFRQTGDRTVLYTAEDNQRFYCLENLTLERILTAIREKPEYQFWKLDGEFTEFRGENFVLIRRAVITQAPIDSVPSAP
jgi:hypothetical protein